MARSDGFSSTTGGREPSAKAKQLASQMVSALSGQRAGFPLSTSPVRQILSGGYQPDEAFYRSAAAASAADVRADLGAPIDVRVPVGYWAQTKLVMEWFDTDPLFRMLVGRFWEFGNNRADWVVAPKDKAAEAQAEKTQRFLNYWSSMINWNVPHVLPGIDQINVSAFKSLLLGGMAPFHWRWGNMTFENEDYYVPVKMRVENVLSCAIAPGQQFGDYALFLKKQKVGKGTGSEATIVGSAEDIRKNPEYTHLRPNRAFALRFEHGQIDSRVNRTGGATFQVANATGTDDRNAGYPSVPFIQLREAMQQRRGLAASDIRIIDGIINFFLLWMVGNGDTGPDGRPLYPVRPDQTGDDGVTVVRKGTIAEAKDYLSNAEFMDVLELVLPYWIDLKIVTPDTATLLSSQKYWHPTSEILHRFGIFLGEDASNPEIGKMNTMGFEAMVDNVRSTHVGRYWEMIALRIMLHKRNQGRFGAAVPGYHWRPLITRIAEARKEIVEAFKLGRVSFESLMRMFGLSPAAERIRILRDVEEKLPEKMNENTPAAFVQKTVDAEGEGTSISDGGTARGRPRKKDARTSKEDS